jgi:hypothetical protein
MRMTLTVHDFEHVRWLESVDCPEFAGHAEDSCVPHVVATGRGHPVIVSGTPRGRRMQRLAYYLS